MADSYLSISDARLRRGGSGGHKGTRELPRSYSGYAGRHSSSPQPIQSPRALTPQNGALSKLELRAAGEVEASAALAPSRLQLLVVPDASDASRARSSDDLEPAGWRTVEVRV